MVPSSPGDDTTVVVDGGGSWLPVEPAATLLAGRSDPIALLVAVCLRKAFVPLLWLGSIVAAVLAGADERFDGGDLDGYLDDLWSPFAGIVLAIGVRVLAAAMAFVLAWRVATVHQQAELAPPPLRSVRTVGQARAWLSRWPDRFHLAHALRALRWTEPVRAAAAEQAGAPGRRLAAAARGIGLSGWILFVVMVVVLFATGALVLDAYAPGP